MEIRSNPIKQIYQIKRASTTAHYGCMSTTQDARPDVAQGRRGGRFHRQDAQEEPSANRRSTWTGVASPQQPWRLGIHQYEQYFFHRHLLEQISQEEVLHKTDTDLSAKAWIVSTDKLIKLCFDANRKAWFLLWRSFNWANARWTMSLLILISPPPPTPTPSRWPQQFKGSIDPTHTPPSPNSPRSASESSACTALNIAFVSRDAQPQPHLLLQLLPSLYVPVCFWQYRRHAPSTELPHASQAPVMDTTAVATRVKG